MVSLAVSAAVLRSAVVPTVAVAFGLVWLLTNAYFTYPVLQSAVERRLGEADPLPEPVPDDELPVVDVLLAAYEEAPVIERAIRSTLAADYPEERLRLTVLLEPDDEATRAVVDDLAGELSFATLVVPEEYPGAPNKPRALNYGFEHVTGDVVGVIDAEDAVDERLFRRVAAEIAAGADAVQGRLDMVNEDDGWLNLLFRAEYGCWYELVTPAMSRVGYPVPFAGTTCFFRRSVLEAASEARGDSRPDPWSDADYEWAADNLLAGLLPWDPTNVTEDFELGMTLYQLGYDVATVDVTTAELSPPSLNEWLRQRTRWKKGKVTTLLSYRTHPPEGSRSRFHHVWQAMLPHAGPLNVAAVVILLMIGHLAAYRPRPAVDVVLSVGMAFALLAAAGIAYGYRAVSDAPRWTRLRRTAVVALTLPLYWLLQWGADIRALYHAYVGDDRWEKTDHDVDATDEQTPTETLPAWQRRLALGVVLGVGAVLRVYDLAETGLWIDELYTVTARSEAPLGRLLVHPTDPHPPLYYLLVRAWTDLVGTGVAAVRLLSVLFSLGALGAVYLLGVELFDDRTGLFAALLFAVSTFHVHFARTARMYAPFVLLATLSWLAFARLDEGGRGTLAGYVVATTLLLYTHVYGLFVVAAQWTYVALSNADAPRRRPWLRTQAVVGLLALPWLAVFARRVLTILVGSGGSNIQWIPPSSSVAISRTALAFVGYPELYPRVDVGFGAYILASALLFVYVAQLLASTVRLGPDGVEIDDLGAIGQLSALLVVPVAVPVAVSHVVPVYVPRYAAPASVGFLLLAARGLRNVPGRRLRFGLLAVVVASSLTLAGVHGATDTAEPWGRAAADLEGELDREDVLVEQPETGFAEYYLADTSATVATTAETASEDDLVALRALARDGEDLYLVRYRAGDDRTVALLSDCHETVELQRYGTITVYRFAGYEGCSVGA